MGTRGGMVPSQSQTPHSCVRGSHSRPGPGQHVLDVLLHVVWRVRRLAQHDPSCGRSDLLDCCSRQGLRVCLCHQSSGPCQQGLHVIVARKPSERCSSIAATFAHCLLLRLCCRLAAAGAARWCGLLRCRTFGQHGPVPLAQHSLAAVTVKEQLQVKAACREPDAEVLIKPCCYFIRQGTRPVHTNATVCTHFLNLYNCEQTDNVCAWGASVLAALSVPHPYRHTVLHATRAHLLLPLKVCVTRPSGPYAVPCLSLLLHTSISCPFGHCTKPPEESKLAATQVMLRYIASSL